jgi:hypothetical protein
MGSGNTAVGEGASFQNTTGDQNVAIGSGALHGNQGNSRTTAVGFRAMHNADDRTSGRDTYNTALGYKAMHGSGTASSNTGRWNTAIGDQALTNITDGDYNTAVGSSALGYSDFGSSNTAIGANALLSNLASNNTAVGNSAMHFNSSGYQNAALGKDALVNNISGDGNTAIGFQAMLTNDAGNDNTAIGNEADVIQSNLVNATAIGAKAKVNASNALILGGTGDHAVSVGIGTETPTGTLDVTGYTNDASIKLINKGSGSAGFEIRTAGPASQYIDFAHSSTDDTGSGTPDFTNRIISNTTSFAIPGITINNTTHNVGIGTGSPGTSNLLDLASTSKGLVLPRMSKAQRNAISTPVPGMVIYQTDLTPGLRVYNGSNWMRFTETVD